VSPSAISQAERGQRGLVRCCERGEVLLIDATTIEGWRNLRPSEATLFWILRGGGRVACDDRAVPPQRAPARRLVRRAAERAGQVVRPRQLYAVVAAPEAGEGYRQLADVLAGGLAADPTLARGGRSGPCRRCISGCCAAR
jgi:hypothetical protein